MMTSITRVTVSELCECEGLSRSVVLELVQHDIAQPAQGSSIEDWIFDAGSALWMQRAVRLRRDLDVDWVAVALLVDLLREREQLRQENRGLRQRLDRFQLQDGPDHDSV